VSNRLYGLYMLVKIGSQAWLPRNELTAEQVVNLKRTLTITPHKVGDYGESPEPFPIYTELNGYFGVPREFFLQHRRPIHQVQLQVTDGAEDWKPAAFVGTLRSEQRLAVETVVTQFRAGRLGGILQAKGGSGKTVMALAIAAELRVPTLVIVHKEFLVEQWKERIRQFMPEAEIGHIQQDVCDYQGRTIVVGMVHSLIGDKYPAELYHSFGLVISDEVHRTAAKTWSVAIPRFNAKHRLGVSVGAGSFIELRGGVFGAGWVGSIEEAFNFVSGKVPTQYEGPYEILDLAEVESRGLTEKGFRWKRVLRIIRHEAPEEILHLKTKGYGVAVTRDHSVFLAEADSEAKTRVHNKLKFGIKVVSRNSADLHLKDMLLLDCGEEWQDRELKAASVDVADIAVRYGIAALVAVHLKGVQRSDLDCASKSWYNYRNQGIYGDYLPVSDFLRLREAFLLVPECVYTEGAKGVSVDPVIDLGGWAYILGFWIGNGWVAGNTVGFAVKEQEADNVLSKLTALPGVKWNPRVRQMPSRSVEVLCSSVLVASIFRDIFGGVGAYEKFIPGEWIVSWSKENRRQLLQGLVDSDGCRRTGMRGQASVHYVTTSKRLALTLLSLLRSLGFNGGFSVRKPVAGGVVGGRQIVGRVPAFSVYWSQYAEVGENDGRKGERARYIHEFPWTEAPIRAIDTVLTGGGFVYDLEMEDHPSFTANGVLVHNSATPRRKDGADNVFYWHIGPIIFAGKEERLIPKIKRVWTKFRLVQTERFNPNLAPRHLLFTFLCQSVHRNNLIAAKIIEAVLAGRKCIVLSDRLAHLDRLKESLVNQWVSSNGELSVGYYVGGRTKAQLEEAAKAQVILATVIYAAEGLDIPALDTLFLVTPMSDVEQAMYRICRVHEGKKDPIVVDFRDDSIPMFEAQGRIRDKFYLKLGA